MSDSTLAKPTLQDELDQIDGLLNTVVAKIISVKEELAEWNYMRDDAQSLKEFQTCEHIIFRLSAMSREMEIMQKCLEIKQEDAETRFTDMMVMIGVEKAVGKRVLDEAA